MPFDIKARVVQAVVDAIRLAIRLPPVALELGAERGQFEQDLRQVERALAAYRAAPGRSVQANVGILQPIAEIGQIAFRDPRVAIGLLVLFALSIIVIAASDAQQRAAQNLNDVLNRLADRIFRMSARRPLTSQEVRNLAKRVEDDIAANGGDDGPCRDKIQKVKDAFSRLKRIINNPTFSGGYGTALLALQEAIKLLYDCLQLPYPPGSGLSGGPTPSPTGPPGGPQTPSPAGSGRATGRA